jgi:hypothetical protein
VLLGKHWHHLPVKVEKWLRRRQGADNITSR